MLSLDDCLKANRPLTFVVAESDLEVLLHLNENYKEGKFHVYSKTLANVIALKDLLQKRFSARAGKGSSTIDVLDGILGKDFGSSNKTFETYIFLDAENYIHDTQNVRKIKDIISRYQLDVTYTVNLIFISQTVSVPAALERLGEMVFFDLPSSEQLKEVSDKITKELDLKGKKAPSDEVVNNLKGLTKFEVEQAYLQSFTLHESIDIGFVRDFKKNAIAKTDLLSLLETDITFNEIGGMENLKRWIQKSFGGWTVEGKNFGLPPLKGLLLVGLPGCGKAQPLDSIVCTPKGFQRMGEMKPGMKVCTPSGKIAKILKVFPQGKVNIYKITFKDGASVECSEDHLWQVTIRNLRHQAYKWIVPTKYLLDKVKEKGGSNNLYVQVPKKVNFRKKKLPIDPYLLGLLLGDGSLGNYKDKKNPRHLEFTSSDMELVRKFRSFLSDDYQLKKLKGKKYQYSIRRKKRSPLPSKYQSILKTLGIWGHKSIHKFIPPIYLESNHSDRIKLLNGLMDSDGDISKNGMNPCYCTSSKKLAYDFKLLTESLGGICTITSRMPHYKTRNKRRAGKRAYRCWIKINMNPFTLKRRKDRFRKRTKYERLHRIIEKIELMGKKEAQCIALDDIYNLYMTDNFIVTHNSLICKAIGNEWGLPLIQLDPSRIFSSRVGDSEANMRRVLKIIENISPAILMVDEIEKGFAGMQSSTFSDAGVTARVIGSFLIWLQECKEPIFTVATSNNIQYLPPELISRFDETFFVNLPQFLERIDIFRIHLEKLKKNPAKFHLQVLAQSSQDLSGREIEQALKEAMYDAFHEKKELTTETILNVLTKKTNLLTTMAEQLNFVLKWVGWDEDKKDGIRARYANPVEAKEITRVQDEIEKLIKDVEDGGSIQNSKE